MDRSKPPAIVATVSYFFFCGGGGKKLTRGPVSSRTNRSWDLLALRKVMSARPAVCNGTGHENRRRTRCLGISPPVGRATYRGRILDRGGGELRRRRSAHRPTLGRCFSPTRCRWLGRAASPGTAPQVD